MSPVNSHPLRRPGALVEDAKNGSGGEVQDHHGRAKNQKSPALPGVPNMIASSAGGLCPPKLIAGGLEPSQGSNKKREAEASRLVLLKS